MQANYPTSELDIVSPRFDQDETDATIKYCIVASQRTGSYLLCRQLISAGIGVPTEYFHSRFKRLICKRQSIDIEDTDAYVRFLLQRRTSSNGVFGFKMQRGQYLKHATLVDQMMTGQRFVVLYRSDLLKQAISLHASLHSGVWGNDPSEKLTRPDPLVREGDLGHIHECVLRIVNQTNWIKEYFARLEISPLVMQYETFVKNQIESVARFAEYLNVDVDLSLLDSEQPRPSREDRDAIYQRYCRERAVDDIANIDDIRQFELKFGD